MQLWIFSRRGLKVAIFLEEEVSVCLEAVLAWDSTKIFESISFAFYKWGKEFWNYGEGAHKASPLSSPRHLLLVLLADTEFV